MEYRKMSAKQKLAISTLAELKASGYQEESIKEELRRNLINKISKGITVFEGIWGYDDTVIPELERAILSRHNINLLGLRGQAKTRIARMMVNLLDEVVPVIEGSDLNEDPLNPITYYARHLVAEKGDQTPVAWMKREDRFTEKLATPDVSIADLIGDVDPIKAATLKLPYSDERVIHFGLVPRSNRCIFVINELPDLQARIQVALFNILQEGDIQIRGFKLRMPLEIQFVFTANPEDYTNRGSIVTPLKDRIDSQIITHYPGDLNISKKITQQEAKIKKAQSDRVSIDESLKDLIEQIAFEARDSEYVDAKSGVSARLTISAYETLVSSAEHRALKNKEKKTFGRVSDLYNVIPAITGKVELVYEGEQEGAGIVASNLVGKAVRTQFLNYFPNPEEARKQKADNPFQPVIDWFGKNHVVDFEYHLTDQAYKSALDGIPQLKEIVKKQTNAKGDALYLMMELALHGLAEYSMLSKSIIDSGLSFKDLLSSMFSMPEDLEDGEEFI